MVTLEELKEVYKRAADQPADPLAKRFYIIGDGLAAVLDRLADYFERDEDCDAIADLIRSIAHPAKPEPKPDVEEAKAADASAPSCFHRACACCVWARECVMGRVSLRFEAMCKQEGKR